MPPWLEWSMPDVPSMAMSVAEAMAADAVVVMCIIVSWFMVAVPISISISIFAGAILSYSQVLMSSVPCPSETGEMPTLYVRVNECLSSVCPTGFGGCSCLIVLASVAGEEAKGVTKDN